MIIEQPAPLWCDLGWEGEGFFPSQPWFSLGKVLALWVLSGGGIGWITWLILHVMLAEACPAGIIFPGVFFPFHCIYSKISLINFCSKLLLPDVVHTHTHTHTHTYIYMQWNIIQPYKKKWVWVHCGEVDEPRTLYRVSQKENKYHISMHIYGI